MPILQGELRSKDGSKWYQLRASNRPASALNDRYTVIALHTDLGGDVPSSSLVIGRSWPEAEFPQRSIFRFEEVYEARDDSCVASGRFPI